MIVLQPTEHFYPEFIKYYVSEYDDINDGYTSIPDMVFLLPKQNLKDYYDPLGRFTIRETKNFTEFTVYKGTWFDGVTMGIDYDTRMMFALLHDMACHATREAKDHSYRDALNDLAYEIVTAQNGFWFNGLATERAVKKYSKLMKIKGEF